MSSNTAVRSFYKLGLRVLVKVALHRADYFSLDVRVCEEIAINVIICQVSHDVLMHICRQCCRQWVEMSGLSIGSGVMWCPMAEEDVLQRRELSWLEKCKS
jgi:hypothetical protein